MTTTRLIISVLLCLCCVIMCEAVPASQYICRRASGKITIDGKLDEAAWQNAKVTTLFVPVTDTKPLSKTEARVLWDDNYLYVSYVAFDKDIWAIFTTPNSPTCQEDCLECFIQPNPKTQPYYNFEINALGTVFSAYHITRNAGGADGHRWLWNCKGLRVGIQIDGTLSDPSDVDRRWQMEIAIPFAELPSLNGKQPKTGDVWRFLLARYDYSIYLPDGMELSCNSHLTKVDFHEAKEWSELRFAE